MRLEQEPAYVNAERWAKMQRNDNWYSSPITFSTFSLDVAPRSGHTVNRLQNNLYIFGGYDGSDRVSDLLCIRNIHNYGTDDETVDMVTGSLPPQCGRAGHVAFTHKNGLYIYGGYNTEREVLADMFRIDGDSRTYQPVQQQPPAKGLVLDRRWHSGNLLSQKLIIFGGWNKTGALSHASVFDIDSCTWKLFSITGPQPQSRRWHTIEHLSAGQLILFGGYDAQASPLNDCWILDAASEKWLAVKQPPKINCWPSARCRHSFTRLGDEGNKRFLLIGGYGQNKDAPVTDMWIFHSDDHSWELVHNAKTMFPCLRAGHSATYLFDLKLLLIFGGFTSDGKLSNDMHSIQMP